MGGRVSGRLRRNKSAELAVRREYSGAHCEARTSSVCQRAQTILLGNKSDLERYRQVSEAEGEAMARKYKTQFAESSATGDPRPLSQLLHTTFQNILTGTRSPSPRLCSSDSEIVTPRKSAFSALRSNSRSGQVRAKAAKPVQLHKTPSLSKIKTGSKLLKLFHN